MNIIVVGSGPDDACSNSCRSYLHFPFPLGKLWIQQFSSQWWVNNRTEWAAKQEGETSNSKHFYSAYKLTLYLSWQRDLVKSTHSDKYVIKLPFFFKTSVPFLILFFTYLSSIMYVRTKQHVPTKIRNFLCWPDR